ncbi:hypothetical protein HF263_03075 [Rhizobium leguminosarum]|uniref:hypothetical protein n=1 Tax=Rhizobium leguminosarum TaxID=384 RepID=UPI001C9162BF|nr:hypothetical protein [Rhizobium leguminosarum]MBY3055061.1 hypothetical protein [Rhizobium leguminosarum]
MSAIATDIQKSAAWIAAHRLDLRTDAGKQIANLIAEAIQAERKQNQEAAEIERANFMEAVDDAAKNAFEMGEFAERLRAMGLVKAWGRGLNGSEYLSRSIGLLFEQIKGGLEPHTLTVAEAWTMLCETPDITSPEEYPDHALITMEQLGSFMARAAQ